jgi:hypothetical protein
MNKITKNHLLFLSSCIPARLIIAYLPIIINKKFLPFYGILILFMSANFLYQYYNSYEFFYYYSDNSAKKCYNKVIIFHSLLYFIAGIYLIQKDTNAYIPLLMDAILGLMVFIFTNL